MPKHAKRLAALSLIAAAVVAVPATSWASLTDYGLDTQDDTLLTLDSATGLEWLDLTATAGKSFDAVVAGDGGYTTDDDFRVATADEVVGLIEHAGGINGFGRPYNVPGASTMLLHLGVAATFANGALTHYYSFGVFGNLQVAVIYLIFDHQTPIFGQTDSINQGQTCGSCASPHIGTFLVRTAASPFPPSTVQPPEVFPPPTGPFPDPPPPPPVTEPGSAMLLAFGLAGLFGARLNSLRARRGTRPPTPT